MSETFISYGVKREQSVNNEPQSSPSLFILVVALAIVAAFAFQGSRGLYETTEGRYAEAAREMVETGNYLVPTLDYQPHWTKPPLAYWGIAAGIFICGQNEWGVRLFNILSFFITVILVMALGAILWEQRIGILAGLVYLSSPFPFFGSNVVSTDTLLTLWEVGAVFCYFKAYSEEGATKKAAWIIAMWIVFGLGFLTKGPPSLLPLIPILIWNYTRKNKVALFKSLGIPLFLVIGFSWFIAVCIQNPHLVTYYLKTEVVDRVSSTAVHNPEWYAPFTIYSPVLLAGQGAWLYFSARGLWKTMRLGPRKVISFLRDNEEGLFTVLWITIPLVIFCLSRSRLELYVLPLYAPIALLIAHWIVRHEVISWRRIALVGFVSVLFLSAFRLAIAHFPNRNNMKQVFAMSNELGSRNREYFVFGEDKLYGMQYYLNGAMQRVTIKGKEPWADASIADLLSSLDGERMDVEYLVLSSTQRAPFFERALTSPHMDVQKRGNSQWVWFRITKKNP